MAIPLRELTGSFIARYENTGKVPHGNLHVGMVRDMVPYEAPEGSCWDAADMLCDIAGKIRKRGGWLTPTASAITARVENILSYRAAGFDSTTALYGSSGSSSGVVYTLNPTTGALTFLTGSAGGAATNTCQPILHGNLAFFPFQSKGTSGSGNDVMIAGGGTAGAALTLTAATVTQGDNRITGIAGGTVTVNHVGSIIQVQGAANVYAGRITAFISATSVRVEPTPTATTWTGSSGTIAPTVASSGFGTADQLTGRYGVSYQGRVVFASTLEAVTAFVNTKGIDLKRNRVAWSQLESEEIPAVYTGTLDGNPMLYGGGAFLGTAAAPYFNYVDIQGIETITGLANVGDGMLLVFGPKSMYKITGQLTTDTVANADLLYSVDRAGDNIGIPAANPAIVGDDPSKSIQYVPGGVIFASTNNIYLYDGSKLTGILTGRNQRYYQTRRAGGDPIYGSAYFVAKNHYILSLGGADQGLVIDLDSYAVTRITNTKIFAAAPDPLDYTKLWGVLWWDTSSAAPSLSGGQLIELDTIWTPGVSTRNDGNGTAVLCSFISKPYMDGALEANRLYRSLYVDVDFRSSASPTATVTADTELLPTDASFNALTQGGLVPAALPQRIAMDVTNQLAEGKAIEVKIVLNSGGTDTFELLGFNIGSQQRALT